MSYVNRVRRLVAQHHRKWRLLKRINGTWKADAEMINNYPIHYLLPCAVWRLNKKIICAIGPRCAICMSNRWIIISALTTYLLCKTGVI